MRTFGPRLGHTGGDDAIDWLTTGLATTELLIVLDNCEHVLAEAAAVASAIVRSCPGVPCWPPVASRSASPGERVRALQPLDARRRDAAVRQPGSGLGQRLRARRRIGAIRGDHLHQRRSAAAGHRADGGAHPGVLGTAARRAAGPPVRARQHRPTAAGRSASRRCTPRSTGASTCCSTTSGGC